MFKKLCFPYYILIILPFLAADPGKWVIDEKEKITEQTILYGDKRTYRIHNKGKNPVKLWIKKTEDDRRYKKLEILSKNYIDICCAQAIIKQDYGSSQGTYYRASKDTEAVAWSIPEKYVKRSKKIVIYFGEDKKFFRIWLQEGYIKVTTEGKASATLKKGQSVDIMGKEIKFLQK